VLWLLRIVKMARRLYNGKYVSKIICVFLWAIMFIIYSVSDYDLSKWVNFTDEKEIEQDKINKNCHILSDF